MTTLSELDSIYFIQTIALMKKGNTPKVIKTTKNLYRKLKSFHPRGSVFQTLIHIEHFHILNEHFQPVKRKVIK